VNAISKKYSKTNWKLIWILNSAILLTATFVPTIADPFNSPKFWVLLVSTSIILGPILGVKNLFSPTEKRIYLITKSLLAAFLVSAVLSGFFAYNKQIAFLGENFRRNGILTIICYLVFFLGAIKLISFINVDKLFSRITFAGLITGFYSLLQITNNDFVNWSDQSAVISTLGNSNFAGSAMAVIAVVCLGQTFAKFNSRLNRLYNLLILASLLFAIQYTNARQAIFVFVIGSFIILTYQALKRSKKLALMLLTIFSFLSLIVALGIFQIGPLQEAVYKSSISIRGFYWRAAIEMFKNYPLLGVGIDNYGSFFKQYRETQYSLNYGFGITSTNAHNVYLQYFATGGLFVGISYVLLQLLIVNRAWVLFKNSNGNSRDRSIILVASWVAFQAQSLISIDNLGLSVWGWIIGGAIIGMSLNSASEGVVDKSRSTKSIELKWKTLTLSSILFLSALFLVRDLFIGERYTLLAKGYAVPNTTDQTLQSLFKTYASKALSTRFIDTDYKNSLLLGLWEMGYQDESLKALEQINKSDPRNLDHLHLLAMSYEQTGKYESSIEYRKKIATLDPWNAQNYLALGVVYKYMGDYTNMSIMLDKILSFASNDPIAATALFELTKPS
jgi:O-antigen ligase